MDECSNVIVPPIGANKSGPIEDTFIPVAHSSHENVLVPNETSLQVQHYQNKELSASDNFYSKYYDEITNFITTKIFPESMDSNYRMLLKKRAKNYSVKEGTLFYGNQIVIKSKDEQLKMLEKIHIEEKTGIHLGVKKMSHIINSQFFWKGQYTDIANFVRHCNKCTELAEMSSSKENSEINVILDSSRIDDFDRIWQKVEVHLHGPYSNECGESVFITAVIDSVSHFILAKCLPEDGFPSHFANFLLEIFCMFGIVRCYFGETCKQYLEVVKAILKEQSNIFQQMKFPFNISLENFICCLSKGEEKCSWIKSCLESYTNNYLPLRETHLCVFVFKLNTKINNSSSFIKMFNRKPCFSCEDDKENTNVNILGSRICMSGRRLLRSSVLQCRHCEEVFTSKISFRIHQRKHTEEAHRKGMLEGQSKYFGERDRRILRKSVPRHKYCAFRRRSNLSVEGNVQIPIGEGRTFRLDVSERRRAELQANTVDAVRKLLARTGGKRKRRGKYKKFPLEVQDQMAQYAIEHGNLIAVRHFSQKLGVVVSESTVRNIVKCYQCFTPELRVEIGKFASTFGEEAAVSHFSQSLGREIRLGLVRKFKNQYLCRNSETKRSVNRSSTNQCKDISEDERGNSSNDVALYSADVRNDIGQYACDHTIPVTIDYFSKKFNLHLKDHIVRKCKKIFKDKQKLNSESQPMSDLVNSQHYHSGQQQLHLSSQHQKQPLQVQQHQTHPQTEQYQPHHHHYHQQLQQQQQQQKHPQQQQQEQEHQQQQSPLSPPPQSEIIHLSMQPHQQTGPHLLIQSEPQQPQLSLMHDQHLHPEERNSEHRHDLDEQQDLQVCQQHSVMHHESLPVGPSVTLLPLHHQSNNVTGLHEGPIQSSSQTIDILQSSLNLLNNPQMNNSTTIIYNPSYQVASAPPPGQFIPINQQPNSQLSFQSSNQCNNSNVQTSMPLSYQPQDVPISASVIINQNVATVQTFPGNQMYPTFPQSHPVQPTALAVADNNLPLTAPGNQTPLLHQRQSLSSSGVPTITVAVAPVQEQQFQTNSQSAVVLSQSVAQPILISHSQTGTTLLQHIIDSQTHLTPCTASLTQHLMNEIHSNPTSSQGFTTVVEQQPNINSAVYPQKLNSCRPAVTFEDSSHLVDERESNTFEISRKLTTVERVDSKRNDGFTSAQNKPKTVNDVLPSSSTLILDKLEFCSLNPSIQPSNISQGEDMAIDDCSTMEYSDNDVNCGSENNKQSMDKSSKSKLRVKRIGRKKDNKSKTKGSEKSVEHRRGTYAIYSPEIRAEMGKYAAEHGSQKACDYFRSVHGYNVAESTMRGLRDKYLKKREMCSDGGDSEVTSLGYAPRGRPVRLGQYDEVVQECIKELVKSGEKVSSFLAIATAKHVLTQYEPHLLEENGGEIRLNLTWAKSFLKRSGIKNDA